MAAIARDGIFGLALRPGAAHVETIGRAAQRLLPGRNRVTGRVGAGSGVQPAIVRAQIRAFSLSAMPGNRRRNSIAADSSPSRS
jgi:hypothetical protein